MQDSKKEVGKKGESFAEEYLKGKGYQILGRNLACRYGEIDLVAKKKNLLYFVEIKRRRGNEYGSALESISPQKIRRIKRTAEYLLCQHPDWQTLIPFFSVVAIDESVSSGVQVDFLPDAFQ